MTTGTTTSIAGSTTTTGTKTIHTAMEPTTTNKVKKEECSTTDGANDAKIELKIGVGSFDDKSPTTDRLIRLDKSPIIDHIRKASSKIKNEPIKIEKKSDENQSEEAEKGAERKANGHCDQEIVEEKVEEVKKVKSREDIRPRSNSKMAGLLLSPVMSGRKRKRYVVNRDQPDLTIFQKIFRIHF